jgi:hypothetical protein
MRKTKPMEREVKAGSPVGLPKDDAHVRQGDESKRMKPQTVLNTIERKTAKHEMEMQWFLAKFICAALGICCLATLSIFFLQGFGPYGFKLSERVLHWIGAVTVGEIGTLATLVYSAFFKNRSNGRRRS